MTPSFEILKLNKSKFPFALIRPTDDCIIWNRYINSEGYGEFQFNYEGKKYNAIASRASFMYHNDKKIQSEDIIMHTCDNPSCINPLHLRLGTHWENVQDRVNKGRCAKGKNNGRYRHGIFTSDAKMFRAQLPPKKHIAPNRKMDELKAKRVKAYIEQNYPSKSLKEISILFNIPYQCIRDLRRKKSYVND